ncbi:MAG: NAD(P)H-binding protein [Xanthomonadales bacterium]|nr:NAD(P)H-binding protein [Xanthomonadales bacterium]
MSSIQIALTGATGFIGQHLLNALLFNAPYQDEAHGLSPAPRGISAHDVHVRALIRNPKRAPIAGLQMPGGDSRLDWIEGDLNNTEALERLVSGAEVVIHNAGVVRGRSAEDFLKVNADGTERIALAARKAGVKHFILVSSLAAREPQLSHYAYSKAGAESRLKALADLNWSIVRPPAVYGPGDKELAPLFDSMRKGVGAHPAGADSRFSVIHVSDLARFMRQLAWSGLALDDNPKPFGHTFEPDDGSGGYRWEDIRQCAEQAFQRKVRMIAVPRFVLSTVAQMNHWSSGLLSYAPMLTPGKVNELTHHDWTCSPLPIALPWQAQVSLSQGLLE